MVAVNYTTMRNNFKDYYDNAIDDMNLLAEIKNLKPDQTKFFNALAKAFLGIMKDQDK